MGDGDYMAAMVEVILPIAYQFNPELVLVSAGFDAAVGDPLGGTVYIFQLTFVLHFKKLSLLIPKHFANSTHWTTDIFHYF